METGGIVNVLAVTLAAAVACAGCTGKVADSNPPPSVVVQGKTVRIPEKSPLRGRISVQPVDSVDKPHALSAPAMVEADPARTVNVVPPLTGRVLELKVGLGEHVSVGQTLMVIASGDLAQAYADLDKARDTLNLTRKALDRARGVREAGAEADKDFETAQSDHAQAVAEYGRAETRLKSLGGNADKPAGSRPLTLTAPIAGSITSLAVAAGDFLNDPAATVLTIANLNPVWVTADVPEDDFGHIAKGEKVDVTLAARPGEVLHGTVQFLDDILAADTRRGRARAVFANPDAVLKPNMYATATFFVPQPAQVFVPQSAVLMNNDNTTVFVEVGPWTFERRTVSLGYDEGSNARVQSGLQPGDRVVVSGGVLLND